MLSKIYFYLKDKSRATEDRVFELVKQRQLDDSSSPKLFNFTLILQNTVLIAFEILADIFKFAIILSADSGHGFNTIFRQRELKSCPYSYQSFRNTQRRIRMFSVGGIMALVFVAVTSSLITNFLFGSKSPSKAASFGWTQTEWLAQSSSTLSYADNANWTSYLAKATSVQAVNGGTSLALQEASSSFLSTSDVDFSAGSSSGVTVSGTGADASLVLGTNAAGTWSPLPDLPFDFPVSGIGSAVSDGAGNIFAMASDWANVPEFWKYSTALGVWTKMASPPASTDFTSMAFDNSGNIFVLRERTTVPSPMWTNEFWKYNIASDQWSILPPVPDLVRGGWVVYDNNGGLFVNTGDTGTFFKYDITLGNWLVLPPAPFHVVGGNNLATYDNNGNIYAGQGQVATAFAKYNISAQTWTVLENLPAAFDYANSIRYGADGGIYFNSHNTLSRYDLASSTWSALASPASSNGLVYVNSLFYSLGAGRSFSRYFTRDMFSPTGFWQSPIQDAGQKVKSLTLNYNIVTPASTSIAFSIWAGNTPIQDANWVLLDNVQNGIEQPTLAGYRYFRYQAMLNSEDSSSTPVLNDLTLNYSYYGDKNNANQSENYITSSWYDTGSTNSFFTGLNWVENPVLATGTNIKFQVRSSNASSSAELTSSSEGLASYWRLDNDWTDNIGHNDLVNTTATFGAAKYGAAAASFTGATYAKTAATTIGLPAGSDSRTISVWLYRNPGNVQNGIGFVTLMGQEAEAAAFGLAIDNDMSIYFSAWSLDFKTVEKINNNEWTHLVLTYQSGQSIADGVKIYINGNLAHMGWTFGDMSKTINSVPNMPFVIGSEGGNYPGYAFNGLIDDVAVYNRVLSPQEVANIYTNGVPTTLTTAFVGPDGTANTYFTSVDAGCDPKDAVTGAVNCRFTPPVGTALNNRWFQYKAILETDGSATPQLDQATFNYLINIAPDFDPTFATTGVALKEVFAEIPSDGCAGQLEIDYKVRDRDTISDVLTPGFVTPSFEYGYDGINWTPIDPADLRPGDVDNKAVLSDAYTAYSALWSMKNPLNCGARNNIKVRVRVNDNELQNGSGTAQAETLIDLERPRSNLQAPRQANQFLTHEYRVPENSATQMLDRVTGSVATATDALFSDNINNDFRFKPNLVFNGTSTVVAVPAVVDLATDKPFSIYMIVRMDYQAGGCHPLLATGDSANDLVVCADSANGADNLLHIIGNGMDIWGSRSISTGNQVLILITYNAGLIKAYVDGSADINQPFTYPWGADVNSYWNLGYSKLVNQYFQGQIGYLATWNKEIGPADTSFNTFYSNRPMSLPDVESGSLKLGIIDENAISYNISNTGYGLPDGQNAISGIWQDTGSTSVHLALPWVFPNSVSRDVHLLTRDAYGNMRQDDISIPYAPAKLDLKDLSNVKDNVYKEYISWQLYDPTLLNYASRFNDYVIYRSTDGTTYHVVDYIDDRNLNYYTDTNVEKGKKYYYRVSTMLENGVESEKSMVVSDKADGQGGTDFTPPTIASTTVATTDSTWTRITWTTDELANSVVEYSTKADNSYASTSAAISMVVNHAVVVTDLKPGTDYVFRVKSTDPLNNEGMDDNNGAGFEFKTKAGPNIFGVATIQAMNYSAKIAWSTDQAAQGSIIYSLNPSFASPLTAQESASSTVHEVELTGLTPGETYYYKVTAKNAAGVESLDDNQGRFYTFTAANDMVPPVITNIGASPKTGTETMVDWHTNEPATSRVYYGIEPGSYASSSSLNSDLVIVHVAELYGLTPEQKYYYIIVSSDGSGNTSTSTENSFLSIEPVVVESVAKQREKNAADTAVIKARSEMSSGITVINKTDTTAPNLSKINNNEIKGNSVNINWQSDEASDSFVEYGTTSKYGEIFGSFENKIEHQVKLSHLQANTTYHYRVAGKDANGNLAESVDQTFTTSKVGESNEQVINDIIAGNQDSKGLNQKTPEEKNKLVTQAIDKAVSLLNQFSGDVTLGTLETSMMTQYDALNKLAILVPAPVLSSEPAVNVRASSATIEWQTNKEATSFVAYSPASIYNLQKNASGYIQIVGRPDDFSVDHRVTLSGLSPQTVYHYQVKSKARIGAEAVSRDFTFKTMDESLEITYYALDRVSPTSASMKWVTSIPADSQLTYAPYRDNKLSVDEMKTLSDKHLSTVHELNIEDFEAGVIYQVDLQSTDAKGKKINKQIPAFSTTKDDLPPEISQIQTESMISQAKDAKVQTIITWSTNEPTICQLAYDKGVVTDESVAFKNKITIESGYSRKHTAVITNFEPGTVYSLQISATDSGGNVSKSPVRTIITSRQKETVFDLIVNNFKETFGWIDKIKGFGN